MLGYLGLGSNEGDRLAALRAARDRLDERDGIAVAAASSVYETAPQGDALGQSDFLNACVAVRTQLDPEDLLDACKDVETELGRVPGAPRHAPRPIDVDVLLLGDMEYRSDRLVLPHPELSARRFVLEPLSELDPGLRLPGGVMVAGLLEAVRAQRVERDGLL